MTVPAVTLRRATLADQPAVMRLLYDTVRWLAEQGSDQWSTWRTWDVKMRPAFTHGDVWVCEASGALIATITVEGPAGADPDFWTTTERAEPAVYISKVTVRRDYAGRGLGNRLLTWADDYAYRRGAAWVRFDAWKSNAGLHDYYEHIGWPVLRTVDLPHRNSGVLYQRAAQPHPEATAMTTTDTTTPLLTSMSVPPDRTDPAGNTRPDHMHHGGLSYQPSWAPQPMPASWWPGYRYRVRQADGSWVAEIGRHGGRWEPIGPVSGATMLLEEGAAYVITHSGCWPECDMQVATALADDVGR